MILDTKSNASGIDSERIEKCLEIQRKNRPSTAEIVQTIARLKKRISRFYRKNKTTGRRLNNL